MSERVRDAFVYFNCCWKDLHRFNIHCTVYSERVRCERQRPFLHVFFNENYNYNSFLIQPAFLSFFRLSVCMSLSLSICVCKWMALALCLCSTEWKTRRDSVCISFTAFSKMTRFCVTPLCKSVCSKRHHGKWKKEFKSLCNNSHGFSFYSI